MKLPPSSCQWYCGVCGRVRQQEGDDPCLLATFTHHDGLPLSVCARCYKWWKIGEGTHVRRVPTSGEGQVLVMHKHEAERSVADQDTPTKVERCSPQIWD